MINLPFWRGIEHPTLVLEDRGSIPESFDKFILLDSSDIPADTSLSGNTARGALQTQYRPNVVSCVGNKRVRVQLKRWIIFKETVI